MRSKINYLEFEKCGSSRSGIVGHIRKATGSVALKDKNLFYRFN